MELEIFYWLNEFINILYMEENKTTRELALSWWRGLTNEEQLTLSEKHFSGRDFILTK
jgi:hypothetical protein